MEITIKQYFNFIKLFIEERYRINYPIFVKEGILFFQDNSSPGKYEYTIERDLSFQIEKQHTKEYIIDTPFFNNILIKFKNYIYNKKLNENKTSNLTGPLLYIDKILEEASYHVITSLFRILLSFIIMNLKDVYYLVTDIEPDIRQMHSLGLLKYKIMFYIVYRELIVFHQEEYRKSIRSTTRLVYDYCALLRTKNYIMSLLTTCLTDAVASGNQGKLDSFYELVTFSFNIGKDSVQSISYRLICLLDNINTKNR